MKNARRINQEIFVNERFIIANDLRIIFVELLIERFSLETSERSLFENVSFYTFLDFCRIESESRLRIFEKILKRRKLKLKNIKAQCENDDEFETNFNDEIKIIQLFIV